MSRIRMFEAGAVYHVTSKTVDDRFLFSPNHRPDMPLLHRDCPRDALDPSNDILPVPSTLNVIGASVGRALEESPVRLHAFESNSNHIHQVFSAGAEHLENIVHFERRVNSLIARGVNKQLARKGHVFGGRYRMESCEDDESAEQKLFYALANPVKDGLVAKVSQSPFFSTYRALAVGETLKHWYIDWEAFWEAGGERNRRLRPKDFIRWVSVELSPLPSWEEMPEHRRQTRVRREVSEIERESERDSVIGVRALLEQDPRDRSEVPADSGPQPLCHAASKEAYLAYRDRYREFCREYAAASLDYRNGMWERQFPSGSFRPPLIRLCSNDEL